MKAHRHHLHFLLVAVIAGLAFGDPGLAQDGSSGEITLAQALRTAMERSPALQQARAEMLDASGKTLEAIAPPPLDLTYTEEDIPSAGSFGDGGQKIYAISQGFDLPLLLGARGWLYGSLRDAAEFKYQYTERSVRAEVVSAYAALFAAERKLALARETAALTKNIAFMSKRRYETGESTKLEYLEAKAEDGMSARAVLEAERALADAQSMLAQAIGGEDRRMLSTADSLRILPAAAWQQFSETEALANHPLMHSAEAMREAYRSDTQWRWMEYLPGFSVGAFRQEYQDMGNFWGVELTAHVPLWFFLEQRGNGKQAAAAAMDAEARYTSMKIAVNGRIQKAAAALKYASAAYESYGEELRQQGDEIRRTAKRAYEAGEISYMEFNQAARRANEILTGYYDALAEYYAALAAYERETGIAIQY